MKLLIVDDHALIREGLAALLRQAWPDATMLQAADATKGLAIADAQPDLDAVLLDLRLPDMVGTAAIQAFTRRHPDVPVIVVSVSEDPNEVRQALASGARGYVTKSADARLLLSALPFIIQGNVYVPPLLIDVAGPLPERQRPTEPRDLAGRLTGRQVEVLGLLAAGLSNKAISQALGLQAQTVKTHITAIFKALDVVNRTQAAAVARRAGLLAQSDPPP